MIMMKSEIKLMISEFTGNIVFKIIPVELICVVLLSNP